jgi:hypothetical protein
MERMKARSMRLSSEHNGGEEGKGGQDPLPVTSRQIPHGSPPPDVVGYVGNGAATSSLPSPAFSRADEDIAASLPFSNGGGVTMRRSSAWQFAVDCRWQAGAFSSKHG